MNSEPLCPPLPHVAEPRSPRRAPHRSGLETLSWTCAIWMLSMGASACAAMPETPSVLLSSSDPHACTQLADANVDILVGAGDDLEMRSLTYSGVPGSDGYASHSADEVVGVEFALAAQPGWTVPLLRRRIECYRATRPEDTSSPLTVAGTYVSVRTADGRFFIALTSQVDAVVERLLTASMNMASARQNRSRDSLQASSTAVAANVR